MNNTFSLTTSDSPTTLMPLTTLTDRLNTRADAKANLQTLRSASQAVTHEQCRALLAMTAMENTMMLSAMEAHCYRTAPLGELRYQQIADAYAIGAAAKIVRW